MRRHFFVLVLGSVVFLVLLTRETMDVIVWSSSPGDAAARNSAHLMTALQQLGVYCVFAVLVLGHGLLRQPTPGPDRNDDTDPSDRG